MGAATLTPDTLEAPADVLPVGGTIEEIDLDATVPCQARLMAQTLGDPQTPNPECSEPASYRFSPPCGHGLNICVGHAEAAQIVLVTVRTLCNIGIGACGRCTQCKAVCCSGGCRVEPLG